jgi:hypothetical protein
MIGEDCQETRVSIGLTALIAETTPFVFRTVGLSKREKMLAVLPIPGTRLRRAGMGQPQRKISRILKQAIPQGLTLIEEELENEDLRWQFIL